MKIEEKIIMYDSPEAATQKTLTGWVGGNRYWGTDEHMARWSGCTHVKCECGNIMTKHYTKCDRCRHDLAVDRYNALPFREWDGKEAVCTWDGNKYFFNEDELIEYMANDEDEPLSEIDLLICDENNWQTVDEDYWSDMMPEDSDGELPKEMQSALDNLNKVIREMSPQSYSPGKIRTKYVLSN